jgi:hypothetical protein
MTTTVENKEYLKMLVVKTLPWKLGDAYPVPVDAGGTFNKS